MRAKSEEKKQRILSALIDIVNEKGLSGVKMTDVARKAAIAQGTIYIYFKTKSDLINATYVETKTKANALILTDKHLNDQTSLAYKSALQQLWTNYCTYLVNHKKELIFMQQCVESDFLNDESKTSSDNFINGVTVFFQNGIDAQYLNPIPVPLIIGVFVGFAKELIPTLSEIINNSSEYEKLLHTTFDMCWNAVQRRNQTLQISS